MADIKDIWNDGEGKLPEDKLMAYLEGRLSPEEQHEVETWLAAEGMEADALEGLKAMPATETRQLVNRLNQNLHHNLKKKKRHRKQIVDNQWAWLAVLIVLLLVIVGYMVLRVVNKKDETAISKVVVAVEPDTIAIRRYNYNPLEEGYGDTLVKFKPKVKFNDFIVNSSYDGVKAPIDYKSHEYGRLYRTTITEMYHEKGVNFGGHYCFVKWGCGSPCKQSVIVDVQTGRIYDGPASSLGYEYRADSRMIIVNSLGDDIDMYQPKPGYYLNCPYCIPEIWVWDEKLKKFEQLQ
jgi:hypothetical protein